MPEIPDLEAVKSVLNRTVAGLSIAAAEVKIPLVVRFPTKEEFEQTLTGNSINEVGRRGKYLLFHLKSGHVLAVNLMLTGRLQLCQKEEKLRARTCWVLTFGNGWQLRNYDSNLYCRSYLILEKRFDLIPKFNDMGPEALEISKEEFMARLRKRTGQIKNILVDGDVIAGIGNAYVDEILFEAGIYPFKKRTELTTAELEKLHDAIGLVLKQAMAIVASDMGDDISLKIRDFLKVHMKGGKPCPKCGNVISEIAPNNRITSFCRHCQPSERFSTLFERASKHVTDVGRAQL